jgi:predicted dehydrogenase
MLRVALAGAGMISRHHLIAWSRRADARVVAVCDPDRGRAAGRAAEFGIAAVHDSLDAALAAEPVDAVDIASPRETHAALVRLAAARGLPVLCQKPLTPTLDEGIALVGEVAGRTRLMVHENWRFRPWYRQIGAWLADGILGAPQTCRLSMLCSGLLPDAGGRRPALERQPFMADEERMLIAEALIHHLDVVRWLMGPLRVVAARAARACDGVRGESLATILLENAAGTPVTVEGNMASPGFSPRTQDRMTLIGRRASAVLEDAELKLLGPAPLTRSWDVAEAYQASFDATIAHFVESLAQGTPFETDAADNLETLRLVEHAYWAAGLQRPAAAAEGSR